MVRVSGRTKPGNRLYNKASAKNCKYNRLLSRLCITSLPGELIDSIPGVGFPRWNVELLKAGNGKPGSLKIEWSANQFHQIEESIISIKTNEEMKAG